MVTQKLNNSNLTNNNQNIYFEKNNNPITAVLDMNNDKDRHYLKGILRFAKKEIKKEYMPQLNRFINKYRKVKKVEYYLDTARKETIYFIKDYKDRLVINTYDAAAIFVKTYDLFIKKEKPKNKNRILKYSEYKIKVK